MSIVQQAVAEIRREMGRQGFTAATLAERMLLSRQAVSNCLNLAGDRKGVRTTTLDRIAEALGLQWRLTLSNHETPEGAEP